MKHMKDLWMRHKGSTIYIIGTGPSLRCIPARFFDDKLTIGLNEAYRYVGKSTYNITIHPELIPRTSDKRKQTGPWITKIKNWLMDYKGCDCLQDEFYLFKNNTDVKDFSYLSADANSDRLYVGRGIHTAAMVLAARMGASFVVLVGCDMTYLGKDHHAFAANIQLHGLSVQTVYQEYYSCATEIRDRLSQLYKVFVLSLSPFLGLGYHQNEYRLLVQSLALPQLPLADDVSKYKRDGVDFQ